LQGLSHLWATERFAPSVACAHTILLAHSQKSQSVRPCISATKGDLANCKEFWISDLNKPSKYTNDDWLNLRHVPIITAQN